MSQNLLSFCLVGCGHIGKRHATLITKFGTLTAVCDTDSNKIDEFSRTFNTKGFNSYTEMLNQMTTTNIVVICTPNYLHAPQSIEALNKGFHVLCEKPMALTTEDCLKMKEASNKSKKTLHIVKQNRFNPPVAYVKELLDENKLGSIYSITMNCLWNRNHAYYLGSNWRGNKKQDGGILYTQFSHFFDILIWFFGKTNCISAKGKNFFHFGITDFEDTIVALLNFESGAIASLHFSTNAFEQNMEGSITILGEKGTVSIGGKYLNKLVYHKVEGVGFPELGTGGDANDYDYYKGSMNNHEKVYPYFMGKIGNEKTDFSDLNTSTETIKAIESVYKALD